MRNAHDAQCLWCAMLIMRNAYDAQCSWCAMLMMRNAYDAQCSWCTMLMMRNAYDAQCSWRAMLMMRNVYDAQCLWCAMLMMRNAYEPIALTRKYFSSHSWPPIYSVENSFDKWNPIKVKKNNDTSVQFGQCSWSIMTPLPSYPSLKYDRTRSDGEMFLFISWYLYLTAY